jgi:energy-coupling factor transporter ATP-binding protein EcfA2
MQTEINDGLRIASVQIENVKSVKAVYLEPQPSGLTIIGGKNGQGKTSVLDSIAWALGGAKKAPSKAARNGAMSDPAISLTLSNGIRVERKGKNSALTVTDPTGNKAGQALLDSFISEFAIDLPKFMDASPKEKAQTLLRILGIGDKLDALDAEETRTYNERHAIGKIATAKRKHADELPWHPDAPSEKQNISELISRQQSIIESNAGNAKKRDAVEYLQRKVDAAADRVSVLKRELAQAQEQWSGALAEFTSAQTQVSNLVDESTVDIEAQIADFESINSKVSTNAQKAQAMNEAKTHEEQYAALEKKIGEIRAARMALLDSAMLPLPGLSVSGGELIYNDAQWDCMSSAEQLRVAVAIVRALKPDCKFVLMDKLEQMDMDTLMEFGQWLHGEGLQVIATRVSTGDECSIIIEDGISKTSGGA